MQAAFFNAIGEPLSVRDTELRAPTPDEVVVQVGRCGICGSDLHMTEDPAFGVEAGTVLGHEYAGEVVETGRGVSTLRPGDLVSVIPLRGCGECHNCRIGRPSWCSEMQLEGGGYAEYSVTEARQCIRLPYAISLADGALVEPLAVALHGLTQSRMTAGDRVLVLGAGPIGLATAFWARRMGAASVTVIDLNTCQAKRAYEMGATAFFGTGERLEAPVPDDLGGTPDIVFECVGKPGLIEQAIGLVRPRGSVVVLGLCTMPDTFIPFEAVSKEVCIQTSAFFSVDEFRAALDALDDGSATPRALVTETVSLTDVPQTFEALRNRTHQCKVLIDPG
ncbi:molecular chaperone GroES [Salinisphaera orenii MK-B5]|uniref:Molecular chaperone GroES n=1 Tax=Salinisphaera orenii MK-B5 TaxID=856730 RepID=A0A423PPZ6_9GAMM|nr:alcohol dehydrogenase catalytic domain-containing protein [Salinisphaera orenii]ROO27628.1 molecular chaperone GroES [Salinisphaera orenii MK-B5]